MHDPENDSTPMPARRRRPLKQPSRLLLLLVLVAGMVTINVDVSVGDPVQPSTSPPPCGSIIV